jgi:hypothetical protein
VTSCLTSASSEPDGVGVKGGAIWDGLALELGVVIPWRGEARGALWEGPALEPAVRSKGVILGRGEARGAAWWAFLLELGVGYGLNRRMCVEVEGIRAGDLMTLCLMIGVDTLRGKTPGHSFG